jgi:predicted regulator of Ras-like GTPase activity (Roadblock/LC7/MglB family)
MTRIPGANIGVLGAEDVHQFERLLASFTGLRCIGALLVDRAGRLLAAQGDLSGVDSTAFASLASAGFAASSQLATLLGEEEFSSLYHHGAGRSMFLADVGGAAVLAVLFDGRVTLGMVRVATRAVVPEFGKHMARLTQRGPTGPVVQMEPDWAAEAESEIDRIFNG